MLKHPDGGCLVVHAASVIVRHIVEINVVVVKTDAGALIVSMLTDCSAYVAANDPYGRSRVIADIPAVWCGRIGGKFDTRSVIISMLVHVNAIATVARLGVI